ncbi:MAG: Ornithine decarboxylase [Trizodia sp. TS-e1964]|nr:MAG: Ornithine decarboxylase [Trizodia sp. TS-e1964]
MAPSVTVTIEEYSSKSWDQPKPASTNVECLKLRPLNETHHAEQLIADALKTRIDGIDNNCCEAGEEDAFFVADLGEVYRQHLRWKVNLPRVKPFYAVKCNPDPQVLRLLSQLGTGFDCASKAEIQQILDLNVDPSRIIYAQPCKTNSYVRYAAKNGVEKMTFDNADELYKTKQLFPDAKLFLRISTDDSSSQCQLSLKFGASLDSTYGLLTLAKELGLTIVGVSFHVGSGASDPKAYQKAVQDARVVFDQAADLGFHMKTLDVGGGFSTETFETMAKSLNQALSQHFPPHVSIIGEPGRYYVASAFTLACNVIARRALCDSLDLRLPSFMLYLNDGLYGNFSCIIFDHQNPVPQILRAGKRFLYNSKPSDYQEQGKSRYSLWGPTCDGIDCITQNCTFAEVLDVGDWLYFKNMGGGYQSLLPMQSRKWTDYEIAYTKCSATRFNGFTDSHEVEYVSSEPSLSALINSSFLV